jgi:hypothetical protein
MKTMIAAAMFLSGLSLMPMGLVAQNTSSPGEKDFVSGGRIEALWPRDID